MKNIKKLTALVLAIIMVFAMSATALAAEVQGLGGSAIPPKDGDPNCATYREEGPTAPATKINVTFIMESAENYDSWAPAFYKECSVTLSSAAEKSFTVEDLLNQVAIDNPEFKFDIETSSVTGNQNLTGVTLNGTDEYLADGFTMAGWEFRVNDQFPVVYNADLPGYEGTTINKTYLENGDVVHFFWDNPTLMPVRDGSTIVSYYDYATDYIRLVPTVNGSSVTVQVQSHKLQVEPATLVMNVENYVNFTTPTVVTLSTADGTTVEATTDASGAVTFSDLAAGTYTIKSASVIFEDMNEPVDYSGCLLAQTTGYNTVTIG